MFTILVVAQFYAHIHYLTHYFDQNISIHLFCTVAKFLEAQTLTHVCLVHYFGIKWFKFIYIYTYAQISILYIIYVCFKSYVCVYIYKFMYIVLLNQKKKRKKKGFSLSPLHLKICILLG